MPENMTVEQRRDFVAAGGRTAKIVSLRADGRPHTAILLPGDTHRVHNLAAAENLFRLELDFLKKSLAD